MKKWIVFISVLLSACAGSPAHITSLSDSDLATQKPADLCNAFAHTKSNRLKYELNNRQLFTANEWILINNKRVRVGMSELAVICARGYPTKINNTVTEQGAVKQYIYRGYSKSQYIYISKGKVTAFQG